VSTAARCSARSATVRRWLSGVKAPPPSPRQLDVQIYRLIQTTYHCASSRRLRLRVAGDAREELLARVLPEGLIPVSLAGELPARSRARRASARSGARGRFELTLVARQAQPSAAISSPRDSGPVRDEVWSFAANDRLRVAAVEGVAGIDPLKATCRRSGGATRLSACSQGHSSRSSSAAAVWPTWTRTACDCRAACGSTSITTVFTAVDQLSGTLRRDWRLSMREP